MRSHNARIVTAGLFLLVATAPLLAEDSPGPIRWRSDAAVVEAAARAGAEPSAAQSASDLLSNAVDRHVVLQFKQVPGPAARERLARRGITLGRYLGSNAFFAMVDGRKGAGPAALAERLHQAVEIKPQWKLHPKILHGEFPAYARIPAVQAGVPGAKERMEAAAGTDAAPEELAALHVIFHEGVDANAARALIGTYGGEVRSWIRSINMAVAWLPMANVQALAAEDAVEWLEPPLPPLGVNNDSVRTATQAELVQASPYGLSGSGISVMVYDGGAAYAAHADFGGRLIVRDQSSIDVHATHVAGTVGGNGVSSGGLYRGMAPQVAIQSFGFQYDGTGQFLYTNPGDMETDYDKAMNTYGAVIANNSIGTNVASNGYTCDWEGDYGATDMLIDAIVAGSLGSPMRVIWANGNERNSGRCGSGYHTTAPPACAKNHITVGAINSDDGTMTSFSSWGPTDDGRLKPDLVAPGCQVTVDGGVTSTIITPANGYGVLCGTSMAAPAVTGACALLLQDWKVQYPTEALPRNSLLKVLLTHNAADLGTTGPDYMYGYGALRIKDTIDFTRTGSFTTNSVVTGGQVLYFVPVSGGESVLKVTLAWDDVPGALNTNPELVNDLDLRVTDPNGGIHYPWTLDPAHPADPAVRTKADHVNNIEQVVVDTPQAGTWTIAVNGTVVPVGPQLFSIAASPHLRFCSSAGMVTTDLPKYRCESTLQIRLNDCDLDTDSGTVQTTTVTVASSSESTPETVTLTEDAAGSASFTGTINLSGTNAPGVLWVNNGDSVTVTYVDADNGLGGHNVPATATALVDCAGPVISNHQITDLTPESVTLFLTTDEPARIEVRTGTSCATYTQTTSSRDYQTVHTLTVGALTRNTTYYYKILAEDEAGNQTVLDNGGACFSFTTPDRQKYFTQMWDPYTPPFFDLDGKSLVFTPTTTIHKYTVCAETITRLPVDPTGSTVLACTDDYSVTVTLTGGKTIPFYGQEYSTLYVSSNGYVTFDQADTTYTETIPNHFARKRISAFFDDLKPVNGAVKWRQLSDRVAVTWDHIPEYNTTNSNTFQLVMYFNGKVELAWLGMVAKDGLVGLSDGNGVPEMFEQDELSAISACVGLPGCSFDPHPQPSSTGASCTPTLSWTQGNRALTHEVFFGGSPGSLTLRSSQSGTSYPAGLLANETLYYWRVDELNTYGRTTGTIWSFTTRALSPDFDHDGDVDVEDYAHLQQCYTGTDIPQFAPECLDTKLDGDNDTDQDDAQIFQNCLGAPSVPQSASCLP